MKRFVLILATIAFLVASVNVFPADKGRDPPDPPVVPEPEPVEHSLSVPAEKAPATTTTDFRRTLPRGGSDQGDL